MIQPSNSNVSQFYQTLVPYSNKRDIEFLSDPTVDRNQKLKFSLALETSAKIAELRKKNSYLEADLRLNTKTAEAWNASDVSLMQMGSTVWESVSNFSTALGLLDGVSKIKKVGTIAAVASATTLIPEAIVIGGVSVPPIALGAAAAAIGGSLYYGRAKFHKLVRSTASDNIIRLSQELQSNTLDIEKKTNILALINMTPLLSSDAKTLLNKHIEAAEPNTEEFEKDCKGIIDEEKVKIEESLKQNYLGSNDTRLTPEDKDKLKKQEKKITREQVEQYRYGALAFTEFVSMLAPYIFEDKNVTRNIEFYGKTTIEVASAAAFCYINPANIPAAVYTLVKSIRAFVDYNDGAPTHEKLVSQGIEEIKKAIGDLHHDVINGIVMCNKQYRHIIEELYEISLLIDKGNVSVLTKIHQLEKKIDDLRNLYQEETCCEKNNEIAKAINSLELLLSNYQKPVSVNRYNDLLTVFYSHALLDSKLPVFSGYTSNLLDVNSLVRQIKSKNRVDLVFGLLGQITRALGLKEITTAPNPLTWARGVQLFLAARNAAPQIQQSTHTGMLNQLYQTGSEITHTLAALANKEGLLKLLDKHKDELLEYKKDLQKQLEASPTYKQFNRTQVLERGFDNPPIEFVGELVNGGTPAGVLKAFETYKFMLNDSKYDYYYEFPGRTKHFIYRVEKSKSPFTKGKDTKLFEEEISYEKEYKFNNSSTLNEKLVKLNLKKTALKEFTLWGMKYEYKDGNGNIGAIYRWRCDSGSMIGYLPEFVKENLEYKDHAGFYLNHMDFINHLINSYVEHERKNSLVKEILDQISQDPTFKTLEDRSILLSVFLKLNELSVPVYTNSSIDKVFLLQLNDVIPSLESVLEVIFAKNMRKEINFKTDPKKHLVTRDIALVDSLSTRIAAEYETVVNKLIEGHKDSVLSSLMTGAWTFIDETQNMILGYAVQEDLPLEAFYGFKPSIFLKSYSQHEIHFLLSESLKKICVPSLIIIKDENWEGDVATYVQAFKNKISIDKAVIMISFSEVHHAALYLHRENGSVVADYIDVLQSVIPDCIKQCLPAVKKITTTINLPHHLRMTYFVKATEQIAIKGNTDQLFFETRDLEKRKSDDLKLIQSKMKSNIILSNFTYYDPTYFSLTRKLFTTKTSYGVLGVTVSAVFRAVHDLFKGLYKQIHKGPNGAGALSIASIISLEILHQNQSVINQKNFTRIAAIVGISALGAVTSVFKYTQWFTAVQSQNSNHAAKLLGDVHFSIHKEDYKSTLESLKEFLWLNPNEPEALKYQVLALAKLGYFTQACQVLDKIIMKNDVNLLVDFGDYLKEKECYDLALQCFRQATLIEPNKMEHREKLTDVLERLGRTKELVEELEDALVVAPNDNKKDWYGKLKVWSAGL